MVQWGPDVCQVVVMVAISQKCLGINLSTQEDTCCYISLCHQRSLSRSLCAPSTMYHTHLCKDIGWNFITLFTKPEVSIYQIKHNPASILVWYSHQLTLGKSCSHLKTYEFIYPKLKLEAVVSEGVICFCTLRNYQSLSASYIKHYTLALLTNSILHKTILIWVEPITNQGEEMRQLW